MPAGTNVEYLSCDKVVALEYFQLLDMRYDDKNMATGYNSPAVLLNLNTCANFGTRYRISKADLRLPRLLRRSSL